MQAVQLQPLQQPPPQMDPDPDNAAWISSDEFRMYHFKISLCSKRFNHDWNFCPYAHTGERACRRDPLRYSYTSITCLDMLQKGKCPKGDACTAAHSVFEFWLHPHRYRTEMCKVGAGCNRRICFFAHRPEELRPLPEHLATTEGSAGGKYSLSAALPGSGGRDQKAGDGDKPAGDLAQQQQQQQQHKGRQQQLGGFISNSSSSSSTSIANLTSSMLGGSAGGGSTSSANSPSAAAGGWLLSGGGRELQGGGAPGAPVMGLDGLVAAGSAGGYVAVSAAAAAASTSPQRLYAAGINTQLPPRMPHMASSAAAGYVPVPVAWQQQQQLAGGQAVAQGGLMPMQPAMQQQQQQGGLGHSTGLALQLQQLSLGGDMSGAAAGIQVTAGLAAAGVPGVLPAEYLQQPGPMFGGGWQQQGQQMVAIGQQLPAAAVSSGHPMAGLSLEQQQQQQLLLQGHGQACLPGGMMAVTAAATAPLCGMALQQQQYGGQAVAQFLPPGQVFADRPWHM